MKKVGKFEKVSYEQFYKDIKEEFDGRFSDWQIKDIYEKIKLPKRAKIGDAGYDLFAPFSFELRPNEVLRIPTGIRVKIDEGWWLGCLPRSGQGFNYYLTLANTEGVIDSLYCNSKNEGHIAAKIVNRLPTRTLMDFLRLIFNMPKKETILRVEQGQGFVQGIFIPHGITVDDETTGKRDGGFGHSDKKKNKADADNEPLPGQISLEI